VNDVNSNVEVAKPIHEHGHHQGITHARHQWIEILEAVVLALVAVLTAWSGSQAVRWEGLSAKNYALASRTSVLAQEGWTLAGQDRLYNIITFHGG